MGAEDFVGGATFFLSQALANACNSISHELKHSNWTLCQGEQLKDHRNFAESHQLQICIFSY